MVALTDKQRQVLRFIAESVRDNGCSASLREICDHIGARSTNAASDLLDRLMSKGMLTRETGRMRGRTLTDLGWAESGVSRAPLRRILVSRQGDGYLAALEGNPPPAEAFGRSSSAAIGRLVDVAAALLGIEIVTAGEDR